MNRIKNNMITIDIFFYMGMLLITFDSFPFARYGLGSGKPLSIIPLIIYIVIKTADTYKKKIVVNLNTFLIISLGVLILVDSLCKGVLIYDDLSGFSRAFNMFAAFFVTFWGMELFSQKADRNAILKMFTYIYKSFTIALFFGVLEFVYFYIAKIEIIKEFILLFVRDDIYLSVSKLQFNFGEAGNTGVMLGILFPLTLLCLKRLDYKFTKKDFLKIGSIYFLSIFSLSLNYLIIILLLAIGKILIGNQKYKKIKVGLISLLIISCIIFIGVISSDWFRTMAVNSDSRLLPMLADYTKISQDGSIQTRLGSTQISLHSFIRKPFLGYGWGYYAYAFRENFDCVNTLFKSWELIGDLKYDDLQNFGFIFSILSEAGILGICFFISLIEKKKKCPQYLKPFIAVIIVEMLQNVFIYWISLIVAFYICTSSSIKRYLE